MADFNTHVLSAAAAASLGATLFTKLLDLPVSTALILTAGGTIGGILPDIDLKDSVPSKILFSIIGAIAALSWLFARLPDFTVAELWLIAIAIFLCIRFPCWALFHQFTVHRGALHSLAATLMFGFLSAVTGYQMLLLTPVDSWLLAGFVAAGSAIHLVLDELYSVDFSGARIKRSFGTALKVLDTEQPAASAMVLFVSLVAWFWTPDTNEVIQVWKSIDINWRELLLPDYV